MGSNATKYIVGGAAIVVGMGIGQLLYTCNSHKHEDVNKPKTEQSTTPKESYKPDKKSNKKIQTSSGSKSTSNSNTNSEINELKQTISNLDATVSKLEQTVSNLENKEYDQRAAIDYRTLDSRPFRYGGNTYLYQNYNESAGMFTFMINNHRMYMSLNQFNMMPWGSSSHMMYMNMATYNGYYGGIGMRMNVVPGTRVSTRPPAEIRYMDREMRHMSSEMPMQTRPMPVPTRIRGR